MVELLENENKKQDRAGRCWAEGVQPLFDEQFATIKNIQGRLFQAGYNFSLNEALIPSTSALRVPVSIPGDFKNVEDPMDDVEEEEDEEGRDLPG